MSLNIPRVLSSFLSKSVPTGYSEIFNDDGTESLSTDSIRVRNQKYELSIDGPTETYHFDICLHLGGDVDKVEKFVTNLAVELSVLSGILQRCK